MNMQNTFSEHELWRSLDEMNKELKATISNRTNKEQKLKDQIKARVEGRGFKYANVPVEFLCKTYDQKLRLTPNGSQPISDRIDYLVKLLSYLITYEIENELRSSSCNWGIIDTGRYTADYFDSKYISAQTRKIIERDQK